PRDTYIACFVHPCTRIIAASELIIACKKIAPPTMAKYLVAYSKTSPCKFMTRSIRLEKIKKIALMIRPNNKFKVTAKADIFAASLYRLEPKYCATTIAAPFPTTSNTKMAIVKYWLAAPTPETALSDKALNMNVSAIPININKKTSKKIGHVKCSYLSSA